MGLVIRNGNIVTSNAEFTADIYCDGGVIKAIGHNLDVPAGTQALDGTGPDGVPQSSSIRRPRHTRQGQCERWSCGQRRGKLGQYLGWQS